MSAAADQLDTSASDMDDLDARAARAAGLA